MIQLALFTFVVNVSDKVRKKGETAILSISYSYILPFFLKPGVADLWTCGCGSTGSGSVEGS